MDPRGEQNAGEKLMGIISIHEMAVTLLGKWAHNSCTKKSYSFIHSFANNHWASNMCSAQMKFMSRWGWQEVTDKSAMKEIDTQWNGVIGEGVDKKGLLEEMTLKQISGEKESVMQRAEEHSRQRNSNSEAWGGKTLAKTVNGQQCLRGRGWVPRWGPTQSQHAQSVIMVDTGKEKDSERQAGDSGTSSFTLRGGGSPQRRLRKRWRQNTFSVKVLACVDRDISVQCFAL